jgi:hypothetical protein
MTASLKYLEAYQTEKLVERMAREGYTVHRLPDGPFDLEATRRGERLAIDVRSRERLAEESGDLAAHKDLAYRNGYTGYQIAVIGEPREVRAHVAGLGSTLYPAARRAVERAVTTAEPGVDLEEELEHVLVDHLDVGDDGIRVVGVATLRAYWDAAPNGDPRHARTALYPIQFDVMLDPGRQLRHVYRMDVDIDKAEPLIDPMAA